MAAHRAFVGVGSALLIALCSAAQATEIGQLIADQIDEAWYRHYVRDMLYTHDGDDREGGGYGREHDSARDNIVAIFESFGLEVHLEDCYYTENCRNVVATQPGTVYPGAYYVVGAHYDSAGTPGADDDASGVAGLLEIARILSLYETEYTVRYIAFDLEEWGLIGSEAYVQDHLKDDIPGMIQLDMIAWDFGGYACDLKFSLPQSEPIALALGEAVDAYGNGLVWELAYGGSSDHASFEDAGFLACELSEDNLPNNPCYHQTCDSVDTPDYIDYGYASDMVRSIAGFLADNALAHYPYDCDENGIPDQDEIQADPALDCNENQVLDVCEPHGNEDCNGNDAPDLCDVHFGASEDCLPDGIPDECQSDCNANDIPDGCDIADGTSEDCDDNGVPDECQDTSADCNENGIWDACDIDQGTSEDFNDNGIPDECDPNRTWYVDDDAPGDPAPGDPGGSDPAEDGSPEHPYDAIQEAIDESISGDAVAILDGRYTGGGNKNIEFRGRSITVRSENGPAGSVIDCEGAGRAFYFRSGESEASVVDGLTITNGSQFYGAGIRCYGSSPTIANCTIAGNTAQGSSYNRGGGIYCYESSPVISNCAISGNIAQSAYSSTGGGICCRSNSNAAIIHCTIAGNTADTGGGVYCDGSNPTILNSILWANTDDGGDDESAQIHGCASDIDYSCVQGWTGDLGGIGNIGDDPRLADPDGPDNIPGTEDDDLHLLRGSPCIETGDPAYVPPPGAADMDGEPRLMGCRVDMGADEYTLGRPGSGDLDANGVLDLLDLPLFAAALLDPAGEPFPCVADMNGDSALDARDIQPFIDALLPP